MMVVDYASLSGGHNNFIINLIQAEEQTGPVETDPCRANNGRATVSTLN